MSIFSIRNFKHLAVIFALVLVAAVPGDAAFRLEFVSTPSGGPPSNYPHDANFISVVDYGAVGDCVHDDTTAIQTAINAVTPWSSSFPYLTQVVYFPAGCYLISHSLFRSQSGVIPGPGHYDWWPAFVLMGAGQASTTIKLKDATFTGSTAGSGNDLSAGIIQSSPFAGTAGNGNSSFGNVLDSMTIDAGNNPTGWAVDGNLANMAVIRDVTIQTSNPAGIGLTMARSGYPGLIKNVTVTGPFVIGIDAGIVGSTGAWFDTVTINGATQYGFRNLGTGVGFYNLNITMNGGYAFNNGNLPVPDYGAYLLAWQSPNSGLVSGLNGTVAGTGTGNITGTASYSFQNVHSTLNSTSTDLSGVFHGTTPVTKTGSWTLPVQETPASVTTPVNQWIRVNAPFSSSGSPADITTQLQAAVNTPGASVVYIPTGIYTISNTITIPDNIDRIDGLFTVFITAMPTSPSLLYMFAVNSTRTKQLELRRINQQYGAGFAGLINWTPTASTAVLVVKDSSGYSSVVDTNPGAGSVYLENIAWVYMNLNSSQPVWARHLDQEQGSVPNTSNIGTNLWIMGHKTEGHNAKISGTASSNNEVVGGSYYLNSQQTPAEGPNFLGVNSRFATSHSQDDAATVGAYTVNQFDVTFSGVDTIVPNSSFPARAPVGTAMIAWYSTDALPVTTVFLNSATPRISGSHVGTGNVLTATNGTWYIANTPEGSPLPASYTYQWQRNGTNISGATASTYTTVTADLTTNLTVSVKAVNSVGSSTAATSPVFNVTPTYVGPGDTVTGWLAWYGLRGFSNAYVSAGTGKAININRHADSHVCDVLLTTTGDLGNTANCSTPADNGQTAANFCTGDTCSIGTIYDQSGGGFNLTQTTLTAQPVLLFNAANGGILPLMNVTGTGLSGSFSTTSSGTIFTSIVAQSVSAGSGGAADNYITGFFGNFYNNIGPNNDGLTWGIYNGNPTFSFNAVANVLHAVNLSNTTAGSLSINVDGTTTSGTTGTRAFSQVTLLQIGAGVGGSTAHGAMGEVGILGGAGNAASMHTNQSLYWGTP